jgi:hypothetical protein
MIRMSSKVADPIRQHRRDVWLKIVVPVILPALMLIGVVVILGISAMTGSVESRQVNVVMSAVATCFLALPAVILCLIPSGLLIGAALLVGKGYEYAQTPIRYARRITDQVAAQTNHYAPRVARPFLALNVRLTQWETTLSTWLELDTPKDESHG